MSNDSREFVINFGSLGKGEHEFEFSIKDTFFHQFESSIIEKGDVDVLVVLEKKDNMLLLDFTLTGTLTVQCDLCLEDIDLTIEGYNELIVKQSDQEEEDKSDDVITVSSKEYELNVAQYIYEYLTLLIPMRNVHEEDETGKPGCDPEVLKEIQKYMSPENESGHSPTDPRWDTLKGINPN